ncbi:MAG: c-type cytochrome [Anaerolineae bacterium]|nr:cytochrome c [Thermoflexales bacterium]MDW8396146.1 c-type cytochrome [Anaerolineae bacterium]
MSIIKKIITFRPSFTLRILTGLISVLIMLSVCTVVAISDQSGALNRRATNFNARSVEVGAKVYSLQCARCHGLNGEGIEGLGPSLAAESFVGRRKLVIGTDGLATYQTEAPSKRLQQIGWTESLENYIIAVTQAGIPIRSSNVWEVNHPAFLEDFGGPLRRDQIRDVTAFIVNWSLNPLSDDQAILPPAPGEGQAPRPTPVPLTEAQEAGKQVYLQAGCTACHAIRGVGTQGALGPSLNRIYTVAQERIADEKYKQAAQAAGQPVATTPEEYIRQSILYPNAYVVPQCPQGACVAGLMPQNYAQTIKPEDLDKLVDYLSALR